MADDPIKYRDNNAPFFAVPEEAAERTGEQVPQPAGWGDDAQAIAEEAGLGSYGAAPEDLEGRLSLVEYSVAEVIPEVQRLDRVSRALVERPHPEELHDRLTLVEGKLVKMELTTRDLKQRTNVLLFMVVVVFVVTAVAGGL